MRVGLVHLAQETCSFNPTPTTLEDFRAFGLFEGAAILERCGAVGEVAGFLEVVRTEPALRPVPILRAFAIAGGPLSAPTRACLEAKLEAGLAVAGRLDGLLLQLHGACAAEDEPDVDGRIVALCRAQLGPDVPILLSLDHHAGLTRRMVEGATAIVAHRSQPHDLRDTGRIGTRVPIRIRRGGLRAAIARRRPSLVVHPEQFTADRPSMRTRFERTPSIGTRPALPSATFPMQPWLDRPERGFAVAVAIAGDRAVAEPSADELADLARSLPRDFQRRGAPPIETALARCAAASAGLVALGDIGGTVPGVAAGDRPVPLETILARCAGPALVPLASPATAAMANAAGPGARLELVLGGEVSGFSGPLAVEARVRRLGAGPLRPAIRWQDEIDRGRVFLREVAHAFVRASGAGRASRAPSSGARSGSRRPRRASRPSSPPRTSTFPADRGRGRARRHARSHTFGSREPALPAAAPADLSLRSDRRLAEYGSVRLLIANSNTSPEVTAVVEKAARAAAAPGTEILARTARFGARVVGGRAVAAIAAHALLDTLAAEPEPFDAVLLAMSMDSGLWAARELFDPPVVGTTEAGLLLASALGSRIGMVILGRRLLPLYRELAER